MKAAIKKTSAYDGLDDMLGAGFGDLMKEGDQYAEVSLDDITIKPQVRESFEDEENTLTDMTDSIRKHGVIQPILLRPVDGGPRPYELVCGERRYKGSQGASIAKIPSIIRKMTDDQARDIQFAENIQRKNLTQIEEAKRIQEDLDTLGSVEAVLEKHSKGRAWLSKILSLLTLPEQAKRVVSESISADLEVINKVKTIEKINPAAAKELVDDLKKTRGKEDARKKADAVKETVKPSKKPVKDGKGNTATAKDLSHQEPGAANVKIFADAKKGSDEENWPFKPKDHEDGKVTGDDGARPPAFSPAEALNNAYRLIFESSSSPKMVLDTMKAEVRTDVEAWLRSFYDAGKNAKDTGRAVIQGFRNGTFSSNGDTAFALISFLHGAESEVKFNLLNILAGVKE